MWLVARPAATCRCGPRSRSARWRAAWRRSCGSCGRAAGSPRRRPPSRRRTRGPAGYAGPGRSAAPSRRCGDERLRHAARRCALALDHVLIVAGVAAARGRRADAALAGARVGALRPRPAEQAGRRARAARAQRVRRRPSGAVLARLPDRASGGCASRRGPRCGRRAERRPRRPAARPGDRARRGRRGGHRHRGDLRNGPGHYPDTPLPGAPRNRRRSPATARPTARRSATSTSSSRGDRIELEMPYGRFTYRVERTRIVPPTATWVTRRVATIGSC